MKARSSRRGRRARARRACRRSWPSTRWYRSSQRIRWRTSTGGRPSSSRSTTWAKASAPSKGSAIHRAHRDHRVEATMTQEAVQEPKSADLEAASAALEGKTPQEILAWAAREYEPGLTLACSFGGPSGMVLLDMMMQIDRAVEVFYLDTDFLFPETYRLRDAATAKYGFKPVGYMSLLTPSQQAAKHGEEL